MPLQGIETRQGRDPHSGVRWSLVFERAGESRRCEKA